MREGEVTEIILNNPRSFGEIKFKLEPNEEYENELKVYLLLDLLSKGINSRATLMGEVFSYDFRRNKVSFDPKIAPEGFIDRGIISELFKEKTPDFEELFNIIVLGSPDLVVEEGKIREEIERQYIEEIKKKEENTPSIKYGTDNFNNVYFTLNVKDLEILYTEIEDAKRYIEYNDSNGDFIFFYSERKLSNGKIERESTSDGYIDKIVSLLMDRDVTKLKNGFVLDSVFYETEEEVLEILRNQLK